MNILLFLFFSLFLSGCVDSQSNHHTEYYLNNKRLTIVVQKSTTITDVALDYGISIHDLLRENPHLSAQNYMLQPGHVLILPLSINGDQRQISLRTRALNPAPSSSPEKPVLDTAEDDSDNNAAPWKMPIAFELDAIIQTQDKKLPGKWWFVPSESTQEIPVRSMGKGVVVYAGYQNNLPRTLKNLVCVKYKDGLTIAYGGLSTVAVKIGTDVTQKTILGKTTGRKFYLEVKTEQQRIKNPLDLLR